MTPNLFLVGAPKAGTTAMHQYLGSHPAIYMSPVKEPNFFGSDIPGERYCRDLSEYLDLFAGARNQRWIGESTPWYLYSRLAAEEIKAFSPEARILVMLRNPVDVISSLHSSALFSGDEHVTDLERALELEPKRRRGEALTSLVRLPQATYYRGLTDYAPQLRRYFDVFGREHVHVTLYDDFAADTAAAYRRILAFLGVDASFQPEFPIINPSRHVRSQALRRLYRDPPASLRRFVRRHIPRPMVRRIWTRGIWPVLWKLNTGHSPRPVMDEELRKRLQEEYRPRIRELSDVVERDLESLWADQ